jgi:C4-dicarboxylate transporter, DctQ subunit
MKISRILDRICLGIEMVAGMMMALITILIVVSAIGRYLLSWPVPDAFDLSRLLLGSAIMWGFASVGYRGTHIMVDIVAELMPPRIRKWMDAFSWLVLLAFTILLTWKLFDRVQSAAASGEATMDMRIPAWPFYALICAGVAVSILATIARLVLILSDRGSLSGPDEVGEEEIRYHE